MAEEQEEEDKNNRIRPQERGQKICLILIGYIFTTLFLDERYYVQ